jgi:predicted  nucleic acid-binding Zn-ribbon protein
MLKKAQKTAKRALSTSAKKVTVKSGTSKTKPSKLVKTSNKASNSSVVQNTAKHNSVKPKENHSSTVSLSKLGKAKIKSKKDVIPPRKIEKIIDISQLEQKLADIMKLDHKEFSVEEKLKALYVLQQIDSNVDKIRTIRGELPMEVTDLEDEVAGLETRIQHINDEIAQHQEMIMKKKEAVKDSKSQIKKYEAQQEKVKNNREYESLNKEIEFQNLEIQLSEKRVKEYTTDIKTKEDGLVQTQEALEDKKKVLKLKRAELDAIIAETQKEEEHLKKISGKAQTIIDERLLSGYHRVRNSARNGLAVVAVQRDACGGCFNKIPPQRQLEIRQHKKVIVCEHCGRILVDASIEEN